ncbi:MAG: SprB repeat-containing protein [Saprospiraceae bacterium]|nr:SprB repeat-containing protein [Saprospiraceae bacterium]
MTTEQVINDAKCFGDNNASISLTPSGGLPPYQMIWSDGSAGSVVAQLSAGTYQLTLTDEGGCESITEFTIQQPSPIDLAANIQNILCPAGNDGQIAVLPTGGTPPYTYLWSDGSQNPELTALSAGQYLLTITDDNLCALTFQFDLSSPTVWVVNTDSTQLTITDAENAYIGMRVQGATPPYQFLWYKDQVATDFRDSLLSTNLPGSYQLVVTDANGCTFESEEWKVDKISSTGDALKNNWCEVFPNPAINDLWLKFKSNTALQKSP